MNTYYVGSIPVTDELYHHGIKGQKWGIRRYQNPDGSLTPEGIRRYGSIENFNKSRNTQYNKSSKNSSSKSIGSFVSKHKKGIAIAGGILLTAAAAITISKLANNASVSKGANIVKNVLSNKNGYNQKGTTFSIQNKKGNISGYYSPDYANFLRKMNNGSLPGAHAKNFESYTKQYSDFINRK